MAPGQALTSLHAVSVVVWKHQDRMHNVGYRGTYLLDRPLKLYDHVLWADKELKNLHLSWKCFDDLRMSRKRGRSPNERIPGLALLSLAHKVMQHYWKRTESCN